MTYDEKIEKVADAIKRAKKLMVLTGAGVSTDSGLPDFRGNGGLWEGKDPKEVASSHTIRPKDLNETEGAYQTRLHEFAEFYAQRIRDVESHKPNEAHHILAEWQNRKYIQWMVTQNVDGYHREAGGHAVELHGNLSHLVCSACGEGYAIEAYTAEPKILFCDCGHNIPQNIGNNFIRPNIVLFNEFLPTTVLPAYEDSHRCDLLIAIGSSLGVHPANNLLYNVLAGSGRLIIINNEPTDFDRFASIVVNNSITPVLKAVNQLLP